MKHEILNNIISELITTDEPNEQYIKNITKDDTMTIPKLEYSELQELT